MRKIQFIPKIMSDLVTFRKYRQEGNALSARQSGVLAQDAVFAAFYVFLMFEDKYEMDMIG